MTTEILVLNSNDKADLLVQIADDMKAENIDILDVHRKTIVTDYHVICTGNSDVHVRSIAERLEEKSRAAGYRPQRVEGRTSGWVLLDYGDVVCHVMREEQRQFYDLETLWSEMPVNETLEG